MKKTEDEVVPEKYKDAPYTTHNELQLKNSFFITQSDILLII